MRSERKLVWVVQNCWDCCECLISQRNSELTCNSNKMICENDMVIVRSVDDKCSYVLKVSGEQKIGKSRVYLKELIGKPFGSIFELINRTLTLIESSDNLLEHEYNQEKGNNFETEVENEEYNSDVGKRQIPHTRGDNSGYVDTNTAQKLKDSDISRLKESGFSGGQIIQTLIENSDTFASKTDFAQEKWIKRKERKYRRTYRVIKCNPFNLCEATFDKSRDKICNMRPDSLAQVLSQSGVHSGSRVLVLESMVGLVVGSVAYRMRGCGRILACYGGQQPHFDMVANFNLDSACTCIIQVTYLSLLVKSVTVVCVQPVPAVELGPAAVDVCRDGFLPDADHSLSADGTEPLPKKPKLESSDVGDVVGQSEQCSELDPVPKGKRAMKAGVGSAVNNTGRGKESQAKLRSYLRQGVDR